MCKNVRYLFLLFLMPTLLESQTVEFKNSKIFSLKLAKETEEVCNGLDLLIENRFKPIRAKKIALFFDTYSYTGNGRHIIDVMDETDTFEITSLFEVFGIRESANNQKVSFAIGKNIKDVKHFQLSPAAYNLGYKYLKGSNLILFDLQSSGIRESITVKILIDLLKISARYRIPLVVLDRPNPLNSEVVEGPISDFSVNAHGCPVPLRYGLTLAELALMINEENWLNFSKPARLYIIPMINYKRDMWYEDTDLYMGYGYFYGLVSENALLYSTLFFAYYTNLSYGIGTDEEFKIVGAPWLSGSDILTRLDAHDFSGARFEKINFIPTSALGKEPKPVYNGEECSGINVSVSDREIYRPAIVGAYLMGLIYQMYPHHLRWKDENLIDAIFGGEGYRRSVELQGDLVKYIGIWESDLSEYQKSCTKYWLYDWE